MSFIKLENLNDFIQPGTACIKPVEKKVIGSVAKVSEINLSDCLACSGCITSAETVLVQQQNHEELFKVINENKLQKTKKQIVVSLSLQAVSSLAHKNSMRTQETAERLASFLTSLGCDGVYDINLARHLALLESYREFKTRRESGNSQFPIISSVCPGWICYAEKTNGDLIIPYISKVRSPQQIMGALLKRLKKKNIYHVTLMPCFDKKLEASRSDFKNEVTGEQDVDCVLTPVELEEILNEEGVRLEDFMPKKLDIVEDIVGFNHPLSSHPGSLSGGYAENILISIAKELYGNDCDYLRSSIEYVSTRNSDFIELTLKIPDLPGKKDALNDGQLARCAIVNGFRNIQTIVQRLKRKTLKYDYIEIMACPSGCINGGAQCRPNDGEDQGITIQKVSELYKDVSTIESATTPRLNELLCDLNQMLYTDFHPVPKMQNLTVNW